MHKIPSQDNVDLKQVKIIGGAVVFKAIATFTEGEEVFNNTIDDKYVFPPHPDLVNAIEQLQKPLATMCGLVDAETMIRSKEFGASKSQLQALDRYLLEKLADIRVTGISLSGDDDNRGLIITGAYKGQAINSRRTLFTSEIPFDDDLQALVATIEDETYAYVYQGKKASLDLLEDDPAQMEISA